MYSRQKQWGKWLESLCLFYAPAPPVGSSLGGLAAQRGKPGLAAWEQRGWQDNEGRGCVGLNPGAGVEVARVQRLLERQWSFKITPQSDGGVLKWDGSMVAQLYNCTKNH